MKTIKFSHEQVWQIFASTFTGRQDLQVTSAENDYITFKLKARETSTIFKNPEELKASIVHGYSFSTSSSSYLHLNGIQTISQLINGDFLNSLNLNLLNKCQDNLQTQIMTCKIQTNNLFQLKKTSDGYQALQSLLSSENKVTSIMLGNSPMLKEEDYTGKETDYGSKIVSTSFETKSNSMDVSINYGTILQKTESERFKKPDLISNSEGEFFVTKKHLLSYAQEIFPSGIIYVKANNNKLQPILFQSMKSDKPNIFQHTNYNFIVDLSSSMSSSLTGIKNELVQLISKLITNTSQWTINITTFSSSVHLTNSFDNSHSSLESIENYINSFRSEGNTALYAAMENVYSKAINHASDNTNTIIFTFTDGENNIGGSEQKVIEYANKLRESSPQSTMYNIGYKSYSQNFFDTLSKNTAAKTIHLDRVQDMEDLRSETQTINNCKVLYAFSSKQYAQCASGDIFIPSFTVDENTSVTVGGETYFTGLEN